MSNYKLDTICVQGGYKPENGEPRTLPIYQSTTYKYDSADHLGDLFDLKADGHMYSRISNPTLACVEAKIAEMEGGVGAMLVSSGQAANLTAVLNITSAGQNIISLASIYGGTVNLFAVTLKKMGIEVRFATPEMTDAEIEATPVKEPHLCDGCGECVRGCPGHAISEDGTVDPWQCAVYYNGANGTKNPFMPPDAFANFEDRLDIIAGEAKVTPEKAREILRNIYFYPPAQHAYQCSICGRACDMNCYVHLEEKGLLSKNFNTPFRKREEWKFDIQDFKKKGE